MFSKITLSMVLYTVLGSGVLVGAIWWYQSAIANAKQQQAQEDATKTVSEKEKAHQEDLQKYEADMQKFQTQVEELQKKLVQLAAIKAASVQRVEVITQAAEVERAEVSSLGVNDRRAAIRQRLTGTIPTASPAPVY